MSCIQSSSFSFIPQTVSSQKFLCSKVNLPLLSEHKSLENKILGPPLEKHSIQGDGNCLFRALSYIVTGRQTDHHILRSKVIEHMKTIEVYLLPHMKCSLENYLQKSQMRSSGTWGTDIEIFAAACHVHITAPLQRSYFYSYNCFAVFYLVLAFLEENIMILMYYRIQKPGKRDQCVCF